MAPSSTTESKSDCCESTKHPPENLKNGNGKNNEEIQLEDCNDSDSEVEVDMVVPPDGGWGWVIVAASFMCNVIVDGIIFSFGTFLDPIAQEFKVSKSRVAFASSLQTGFYLMAGPFVSALANRYGFRSVAIVGSFVSCLAFVLSYFSTSIEFLYFSYGLIGGIGAGLIYVPAVITAGFYFERWRALATGIAVCGSGIGAFILAPVSQILVKNFNWRQALLIQSGMLLNCAICGAMFRPLKPSRIKVKKSEVNQEGIGEEVKSPLVNGKSVSTHSLRGSQHLAVGWIFGTNNNAEYPTAAQVIASNPNIVKSIHSAHNILGLNGDLQLSSSEKRLSVPLYSDLDVTKSIEIKKGEENNLLDVGDLEKLNGRLSTQLQVRRHTISGRRDHGSQLSLKKAGSKRHQPTSKDPQRPFYRDDIFYGGSLARLPHYKSQLSSVGYHMSVTRLPTTTDVEEEKSGRCYLCPESVSRILVTMLDIQLLKSPSFFILAISGGLTMMGFFAPFTYLPDRGMSYGFDNETATFLVSTIGITNTIGRIVCGTSTSLPGVDALVVNNVLISISGIATIISALSHSKGYQFFYAAIYGSSVSAFAALRSILVVELVGLEKLTNAFGLLLLFQGVAALIGSPLAGKLMEATGNYDASFYLSGTLILLSAVICYPLKRINDWEKQRNNAKSDIENC
ncbi:monocarboxylate transporter 14 [Microplitis demolitor]|uniref:monocarboxylate transporter 14 n=1 Tax=Microplitis demolitor TaxID=69319 RepID=UPI0004CDD570|nr:monocarboxylate transporter 14 [Microplitis demolitor]XP_014294875.1 monocarboxylate transporter 14 [Microplitis demolitor]XP_053596031.1 monocarboxylate transporter 14 [Microplitis demolitor]XP_053596032.1 monocarboxylate transporter 14 [Microplitis demolitor]XP_053596033.1 monocarboxylate transporter 14 [Microplitis demolitor]